ncbi:MAG: N-acetyltransferase family protein [Verrucomicrobium sp.]
MKATPSATETVQDTGAFPKFVERQSPSREAFFIPDYGPITFRPIDPQDEQEMVRFHEALSEESISLRYFEHMKLETRTTHHRLQRVCQNSPDTYAIVAERPETPLRKAEIVAVARLNTTEDPFCAEASMVFWDEVKGTSLPARLLRQLIIIARASGFSTMRGDLLPGDYEGHTLFHDLGFATHMMPEDGIVRAVRSIHAGL